MPDSPAALDCGRVRRRLPLLVHGLLFGRTRPRLLAHLAACPMCRTERYALEQARNLESFLFSLTPTGLWGALRRRLAELDRIRPIALRAAAAALALAIWSVCALELARGLPELAATPEAAPPEPLGFDYRQPQTARAWSRAVPGAPAAVQPQRPPQEVTLVLWVTDPGAARRSIDALLASVAAQPLAAPAVEAATLAADVPVAEYNKAVERITALGVIDYVIETPSTRPRPSADTVRLQIQLRQDRWGVSPKL